MLENVPAVPPLDPWTEAHLFSNIPKGAPGLDGQTGLDLQLLHRDALKALCALLSAADRRHLPTFWRAARVTLIPKEEGTVAAAAH